MSNLKRTSFDLVPILDQYKDDENVLDNIIKEKDEYNNLNLATKAKYGETLIVKTNQLVAFAENSIETCGNLAVALEKSNKKLDDKIEENFFLKKKLDQNDILYEEELNKIINNKNKTLILKTPQAIHQKGVQALMMNAKKNRKL
jgi:uncharacterized protein YqkB